MLFVLFELDLSDTDILFLEYSFSDLFNELSVLIISSKIERLKSLIFEEKYQKIKNIIIMIIILRMINVVYV